jgi:hypothetical protein
MVNGKPGRPAVNRVSGRETGGQGQAEKKSAPGWASLEPGILRASFFCAGGFERAGTQTGMIATAMFVAQGGGAGGFGSLLIPLGLMFGIMYFLVIMPQQRQKKNAGNAFGGQTRRQGNHHVGDLWNGERNRRGYRDPEDRGPSENSHREGGDCAGGGNGRCDEVKRPE